MNNREVSKEDRIDLSAPNPLATINRSATARALKINVSNVSRILSRERIPHIHTLKALADYLSLSLDEMYALLYVPKA